MDKLTDAEIIKAFEVCYIDRYGDCSDCPFCNEDMECKAAADNNLLNEVFELTNRQKAEIERLQKAIKVQDIMIEQQDYKIKSKSEAIKEFAERLKKELRMCTGNNGGFIPGIIDNLVKEMLGKPSKVEHDSLCETETYKAREG